MNQLDTILAELAAKIGVTVDHLWPQLVLVTFAQSLFWTIADPIFVVASSVIVWKVCRYLMHSIAKLHAADDVYEIFPALAFLCVVLVWLFVAGNALATYPADIAGVVAPEGMTVVNLLKQVTTK